eukprot:TCALIF_12302-PA protein Name:"Similar to SEC23IP SEC23-interacting protein (Homo sapiens)" AED:0.13 eAED:0.13 QI:0/0.5/0.33/0.66/1/1/3/249/1076
MFNSFGGIRAPALLTPVAAPPVPNGPPARPPGSSTSGTLSDSFNLTTLPPLATPTLSASSSSTSLGPPPPGVFLLPGRSEAPPVSATSAPRPAPPPLAHPAPPPGTGNVYSLAGGGGARATGRYVAPPDIPAQVSVVGPPTIPPVSVATLTPRPPLSSTYADHSGGWAGLGGSPSGADVPDASPFMTESSSLPDLFPPAGGPPLASAQHYPTSPAGSTAYRPSVPPVAFHWFYHAPSEGDTGDTGGQWQPFTMIDSVALEDAYMADPSGSGLQPTHGGRYDVSLAQRQKRAVYWTEAEPSAIRRCSWFHKSNVDGRWSPYTESVAAQLEAEYVAGVQSGQWNKKLELENGEHIILHSPSVMMHFPSHLGINANLDDWGQVQPQDPQQKPRVVHRGLEGLPEIPDGETPEVDHLVFVVHGIGSVCDIRFRSIVQVVDGFRELSSHLSDRHFQSGRLAETVNRIEYLPVNWHKTLHGEDTGTDRRIRPLALKSIPKLREFVSDTLLDILFYTSPIYCQTIINTVVCEINRMYTLFMKRNPHFTGTASVMGHSLGSLILFDVLSHQTETDGTTANPAEADCEAAFDDSRSSLNQSPDEVELALERVFDKLGLSEFTETFTREGIDMQSLLLCTEDDLKESGLPLGPRKKLQSYIETQKAKRNRSLTGLEAFMQSSVTEEVKYSVGPAGTGQPSVEYPALCFKPAAFYALGSPISMFLAVRGMDTLGKNFKLPTCSRFFNIFHPYDPVAYRIESLIDPEYAKMRPLIIPHHKGRKRMHLEIKDTVTKLMTTDFKQKIFDSFSATLNTMYNIAVGSSVDSTTNGKSETLAQALEDSMKQNAEESEQADRMNPRTLESPLNSGKRIDFALQEAPLESFNEYLFALASHLVYWESEDTCLMIVKDIYEQMSILSDEAKVMNSVPYLDTTTQPPALQTLETLQQSKTPILAPPPVPMGGTMSGPAVRVNPTSVELPPVTSPTTNVNILGPTPTAAVLGGGYGTNVSTPLGPPPIMMPPSSTIPNPLPTKRTGPYPQPIFPPSNLPATRVSTSAATNVLGMDPTAPVANQGPIAPPPMAGFYSKK